MSGDQHIVLSDFPMTVADAVSLTMGELSCGEMTTSITHASMLEYAGKGAVCFAEDMKAFGRLTQTKDVTCLITQDIWHHLSEETNFDHLSIALIIVDRPKDRFAVLMARLYPPSASTGKIDAMASISADAAIGQNVQIDAFVRIGCKAVIGDNTIILSGAVIGDNVIIGQNCLIMPGVHIEHATLGDHVQISSGSVIGHIGFGVTGDGKNQLISHIGKVIIGDHCYIGALNSIDRGMLGNTVLGSKVMTDSQCHIAHNVQIGNGCIICAKSGIAGSVTIGERNILGPDVGVASHVNIGSGNLFASRSGITKDVSSGNFMGGFPAVPIADYRVQVAAVRRMARNLKSKAGKE